MNRQSLVARYIALQQEAEQMGIRGSAHITEYTSDAEILRFGKELRARVDEWKNRIAEHNHILGIDTLHES